MAETGKSEEEVKKDIMKECRAEMRSRKERKLVEQRMAQTGKSEEEVKTEILQETRIEYNINEEEEVL